MADEAATNAADDESKLNERENKLWIGNIDKNLTEYQLIQVLKKFGEIKKFEFLFHFNGPMKGEPRGYCFVEFETKEQSVKVINSLNGKKVCSKCLIVDWAKPDQKCEESKKETNRKSKELSRRKKIEMIQAKLATLDQDKTTCYMKSNSNIQNDRTARREDSKPYKIKHKN